MFEVDNSDLSKMIAEDDDVQNMPNMIELDDAQPSKETFCRTFVLSICMSDLFPQSFPHILNRSVPHDLWSCNIDKSFG